ncbi:MAG: hypothetical protein OXL97_02755 [Chloroflexota bacterium]|nr:hypothetical protein [Chloroflexota bacterium]MDE2884480.1 hypothetical protein [Chloroflexota bacterium]
MATNMRKRRSTRAAAEEKALEPARTHGMLMEVNWQERTAQLHPTRPFPGKRHVPLRFPGALDAEMLRHATRFVTVVGKARFNENDEYEVFHVEEIIPPRGNRPFSREELEEALANAKPFVPGEIPPMDIPEEEMEEFRRVIREARNVR